MEIRDLISNDSVSPSGRISKEWKDFFKKFRSAKLDDLINWEAVEQCRRDLIVAINLRTRQRKARRKKIHQRRSSAI